jgi:uncharacterized protein YqeY
MDLKTTIQNDIKTAMKAQDSVKLGALRMLSAEIKKREIDKRTALDDAEVQKAIATLIKQRQDSIEAFVKGGRQDLADKEKQEIGFLSAYLPAQLPDAEVEKIVAAAIQESGAKAPSDIGKVMKVVLPKIAGRADGKKVNEIVRALLGKI